MWEYRGYMNRITYTSIVKDSNPNLRQKSEVLKLPLQKKYITLAKRMLRYVKDSRDDEKAEKYDLKPAVGLAAPQVGVNVHIIVVVVDDEDGDFIEYCLANPKIISHSVQKSALSLGEGCLSVEIEHQGLVHRSARIKVRAFDILSNQEVEFRATGYLAVVLQHEIDHLNGVLFYDHINLSDPWKIEENTMIIES
jgi:peptide deformylase